MDLAWTLRRRMTLGLTAVALVAGGGVAIAAGSADDTGTQAADGTTTVAKPATGKGLRGGLLHSESVASDGNGGFVTHLMQVGKIESIDDSGLTVVSDDGFKQAWKRTADTVVGGANWSVTKNDDGSWTVRKSTEDLATGDVVTVVGTKSGDDATAQRIASQPDVDGEIPGGILKGFERGGVPQLQQRPDAEGGDVTMPVPGQMQRRMGGQMGGPGGEMRKFEFRTGPNGEGGTVAVPADPEAPSTGATPAQPSAAIYSGSVSFT